MRTIYKRKWKEEAVSPVIATIMMVAITVVLAAVLYLLVSGLIGGGTAKEPNISLGQGDPTQVTAQYKIGVDSVSSAESKASFKVSVLANSSTVAAFTAIGVDTLSGGAPSTGAYGGTLDLRYTDATGDGKLNNGDWFTLTNVTASTQYQIVLYWKASGNKVSGDTGKTNT